MSRRKKGGGGEDCGSWMDTYGDMVTLLLCFFVMLYSMSSLDQQKWEIFVKSVFPNSNEDQQIAINENILEGEFDVSGNLEMEEELDDLDKLWIALQKKLEEKGLESDTYQALLAFLQTYADKSFTAEMLAQQAGLSKVSVRWYLNGMIEAREVRSEVAIRAERGPVMTYCYAGEGRHDIKGN